MTFPEMLADANETRTGRSPGQWTPAACRVWREADPEIARLLEAALAWELATGRTAAAEDEVLVRERQWMPPPPPPRLLDRHQRSFHRMRLEFRQDNDAQGDG
jgi:hypothetical protein